MSIASSISRSLTAKLRCCGGAVASLAPYSHRTSPSQLSPSFCSSAVADSSVPDSSSPSAGPSQAPGIVLSMSIAMRILSQFTAPFLPRVLGLRRYRLLSLENIVVLYSRLRIRLG